MEAMIVRPPPTTIHLALLSMKRRRASLEALARRRRLAAFRCDQRHGLVQRQRVELIPVRHRRIDPAMLHIRPVAARVQLDRLAVGGMLADHAQRDRAALRTRAPLAFRLELEADLAVRLSH